MALMTVFTALNSTGSNTFTHGLQNAAGVAVTPDYCVPINESNTTATMVSQMNVTFNSINVWVYGGITGAQIRVVCKKIHSIEFGP